MAGRARRLQVKPGSPLIGKTLDELQLRARYGANVIGVERIHNFHRVFVGVSTLSEFKAGDVLLIDMAAPTEAVRYLCQMEGLLPLVLRGEYFSQHARTIGMAEVSLIPDSRLIGKSVREVVLELGLMTAAGWVHHPHEWWHYNLPDPCRFPPLSDEVEGEALLK